jgi:hypothetical protein
MKSSFFNALFLVFSFTAISQDCDNVSINLSATPATNPTSFDGSIEVELEGEGVVESYTWSNGYRRMPAFMNLEQLPQVSVSNLSRVYPVELNGLPGEELVVIGSNNDFQILVREGAEWSASAINSLNQNGCNNLTIRAVSAGELTGDGLVDLLFSLGDSCSDELLIFKLMQCLTVGEQYSEINQNISVISPSNGTNSGHEPVLIDFDFDGDLDLINAHYTNDSYGNVSKVWLNDGFGQFIIAEGFELCEADDITVFDYDLDGDLDVLAFNVPTNSCYFYNGQGGACIYENTGIGFDKTTCLPFSEPNYAAGLDDFNDDGFTDVLCGGPISVLFGNGAGDFLSGFSNLDLPNTTYDGTPLAVDLDYNQTPDILVATSNSNFYNIMNTEGNGIFSEHPSISLPISLSTQIEIESLPFSNLELSMSRRHLYQGNLMSRGLIFVTSSGNQLYLLHQLDMLSQENVLPGDYELCINTTDGCAYCNSVTVNTQLGNDCTDPTACNYNPNATEDDGSCEYGNYPYDCNGNCLNDADQNGICDEFEQAAPFNPDANGDGVINLLDMLEIFPLYGQPFEVVPCVGGE